MTTTLMDTHKARELMQRLIDWCYDNLGNDDPAPGIVAEAEKFLKPKQRPA